jgi:hypothetical protein
MKKHLTWLAALAALGLAGTANAKPVKLNKAQLDQIVAGAQQHFPPGQFPGGPPGHAPGQSNPPGGG